MQCYNCGHENPPQTTFCFKCAARLDIATFNQPSRGVYLAPQGEIQRDKPKIQSPRLPVIIVWIALLGLAAVLYWLSPHVLIF